jgi:hypothetical protein
MERMTARIGRMRRVPGEAPQCLILVILAVILSILYRALPSNRTKDSHWRAMK